MIIDFEKAYQLKKAHHSSLYNRKNLEKDSICGCFYCLEIFVPTEIDDWIDEPMGDQTALCPYCRIDSVLGESSGFPITILFLKEMNKKWF